MLRFFFGRHRREPAAPDPRLAIVLSEAIRALDGQRDNLDNLRSRVGILLSAATIATSFLGGLAFDRAEVGWPGITAVGLFVLHVVLGLLVLRPQKWTFQTSAKVLIDGWILKDDVSVDQLQRALARKLEHHYNANEEKLRGLWDLYGWAIVVLAAEVAMWLGELGGLQPLLCQVLCK